MNGVLHLDLENFTIAQPYLAYCIISNVCIMGHIYMSSWARYGTARHGTLNFASVNGYRSMPNCYVPGSSGPATSTVLARYGTVDTLKQTLLYPWLLYVNTMAFTMAKLETKSSYHVRLEMSCSSSGSH